MIDLQKFLKSANFSISRDQAKRKKEKFRLNEGPGASLRIRKHINTGSSSLRIQKGILSKPWLALSSVNRKDGIFFFFWFNFVIW